MSLKRFTTAFLCIRGHKSRHLSSSL